MGAQGSGASYWTRTARLDVELADGSDTSFFLKVSQHIRTSSRIADHFRLLKETMAGE